MGHPEITIAICTYNRSDALERCLGALAGQTCATTRFEVLVVDNASTDDTPTVARRFEQQFSMFKYTQEPVQGLARARNRALSQCQSEILGFTDDDAIPNPDWVASILETFCSLPESYAAIGGEIEPIWEHERPQWLDDKMLRILSARLGWDTNERELKSDEWICEANCAYRTKALSRYGGLRCPSEHLALKWSDVDWDKSRIRVPSPKTEHHAVLRAFQTLERWKGF